MKNKEKNSKEKSKEKNKEKIYYYKDELNDDFAEVSRTAKKIDEDYKFIHTNFFWKFFEFILYRIIMLPFAYLFCKIKFGMKIFNKKVLKDYRGEGYFLYANHTQIQADGYIPTMCTYPKKTFVISNADTVSLKGTETFMLMVGAIPLPSTLKAHKKFFEALEKRIEEKNVIMIYPEAHIWPYYTKIRPFKSVSFKYPVKMKKLVFCFTNVYKKRKTRKTPRLEVYIDGPFVVDETLPIKEAQEKLRNEVYEKMVERSKNSDIEYISYQKKEETNA